MNRRGRMSSEAVVDSGGPDAAGPTAHLHTLDHHCLSARSSRPNGALAVLASGKSGGQSLGRHQAKTGALAGGLASAGARHRVTRCPQGEDARARDISASRKTCRTCFPRCCLRSGFQTDPVTDDRYYSAPSAEDRTTPTPTPERIPAHLTDRRTASTNAVTPKPADRHPRRPQNDRRTNCGPGHPALPRHPWAVFFRTPQRGRVARLEHGPVNTQHTEHGPADVDVRPDWQYPGPAAQPDSHPRARRPRRTTQPAKYYQSKLTGPTEAVSLGPALRLPGRALPQQGPDRAPRWRPTEGPAYGRRQPTDTAGEPAKFIRLAPPASAL
jgi:hypothetical protein